MASGTVPGPVSGPSVPDEISDRVLSEVYPIANVKNKRIAVVGAGDAAFDYGLNLSRRNRVHILNRGEKRRCLPLLWRNACEAKNITYRENTAVVSIRAGGSALVLSCDREQTVWELPVDYVIFATGRVKNTGFFTPRMIELSSALEADGVLYFAGDVKNDIFRQSSIAIGDGISTAMRIYHKLRGTK